MFASFRQWLDLRRRAKANRAHALRFNRYWTYRGSSPVGGMWCCPSCGTVHACVSSSPIVGRQFPACCEFPAGHRLDARYATGVPQ